MKNPLRTVIWISITIFSTLGSWISDLLGKGWLSAVGITFMTIGCFVGLWVGYKIGKQYF